jgi:zinc-ribbon domain
MAGIVSRAAYIRSRTRVPKSRRESPDETGGQGMSKACLNCGAENADEAKFCRVCGRAIVPLAVVPPSAPILESSPELPAETSVDSVAPSPYVPIPTGPGSLPPSMPAPPARSLIGLWAGLAAIVVALIAVGTWWLESSRQSAAPTFDAAPPPSAVAASGPATAADDLQPASAPELSASVPADAASAAAPPMLAPSDSFDNAASGAPSQ